MPTEMNKIIETIRMTVLSRRIRFKDFANQICVDPHTVTNIFNGQTSPTLRNFLKMIKVLDLEIQYKTDLDISRACFQAIKQAKSEEQAILFLWKNIALQVFSGQSESKILAEIAKKLRKKTKNIKYYWKGLMHPRLDSLIALFAAVNVEIYLATDKNTNLN